MSDWNGVVNMHPLCGLTAIMAVVIPHDGGRAQEIPHPLIYPASALPLEGTGFGQAVRGSADPDCE